MAAALLFAEMGKFDRMLMTCALAITRMTIAVATCTSHSHVSIWCIILA